MNAGSSLDNLFFETICRSILLKRIKMFLHDTLFFDFETAQVVKCTSKQQECFSCGYRIATMALQEYNFKSVSHKCHTNNYRSLADVGGMTYGNLYISETGCPVPDVGRNLWV